MRRLLPPLLALAVLAGCGGGNSSDGAETGAHPRERNLRAEVRAATRSSAADFAAAQGRSLQEVADEVGAQGPTLAFATSILTPGRNRLAFGLIDQNSRFVYGPTALYLARSSPQGNALGPFPAPADSLVTDPPFRSQTAASEKDPFAAIYEAQVTFDRPGSWYVLAVTKVGGRPVAATGGVKVIGKRADPVVAVGAKAPRVKTDTLASVGGDKALLDTRVPPSDMHADFAQVVGRKPVALLFATPQLCQSRVCGPVVDIALQLEKTYGDRMQFIHQEVYVDNDVNKGLRAPLRAFGLRTEPWLFTIRRDGTVAARVEGSFGFASFERAIKAAL